MITGDNLASQYLGGYKSLASALRKCRHCMAVDSEMQTEVQLILIQLAINSFDWLLGGFNDGFIYCRAYLLYFSMSDPMTYLYLIYSELKCY